MLVGWLVGQINVGWLIDQMNVGWLISSVLLSSSPRNDGHV